MTDAADVEHVKYDIRRLLDEYHEQYAGLQKQYRGVDIVANLIVYIAVGIFGCGSPIIAAIITYFATHSIIAAGIAAPLSLIAAVFLSQYVADLADRVFFGLRFNSTRESKKRTIENGLSCDFNDRFPKGTPSRQVAIYLLENEINLDCYPLLLFTGFKYEIETEWREIQRRKFLDSAK